MSDQPNVVCVTPNRELAETITSQLSYFKQASFHHVLGLDKLPPALDQIEKLSAAIAIGTWPKQVLQANLLARLNTASPGQRLPIIIVTNQPFDVTEFLGGYGTNFACYILALAEGWPGRVTHQLGTILADLEER